MCSWNGQQWPCWDNDLGGFDVSDGCYYKRSSPQPPADDPSWGGHDPATGAVYDVNCRSVGGGLTPKPQQFLAQPRGGTPPADQPVNLAWQAIGNLRFERPVLHADPAGTAVVGAPVWLWYERTGHAAGTLTASAPGHTMTVSAVAKITKVEWFTGDDSTVRCTTPGTAYTPGATNPDCSHTYRTGSALKPQASYYLMAKVTWHVIATIDGPNPKKLLELDKTIASDVPLPLRVGEMQVLNN